MQNNLRKWIYSALFLSLGLTLPFLTGQLPQIGNMLLPMHLPVLLCGLICGWQYGGLVGLITPLLRSLLFSAPPLYPKAVYMSLELCTYGLVIGLVYLTLHRGGVRAIYASLVSAMLAGRIVWGIAKAVLMGLGGERMLWSAFVAEGFVYAVPGIVLQLILVPAVMLAYKKIGTQTRARGD